MNRNDKALLVALKQRAKLRTAGLRRMIRAEERFRRGMERLAKDPKYQAKLRAINENPRFSDLDKFTALMNLWSAADSRGKRKPKR